MSDIIGHWRRTAIRAEAAADTEAPAEYVAFQPKDTVTCLEIRLADITHAPDYSGLMNRIYSHRSGTNLILIFPLMTVMIRGRNLRPVFTALKEKAADFIQAFDPDFWKEPADPKAPFIESIKIIASKDGPPLDEMELSFGPRPKGKLH